jgi:hypothetical protein
VKTMPFPKSWVLKIPPGVREQSGWIFIGILVALSGLGYLVGVADSAVARAIGGIGLQAWGGFLAITGFLVTFATWRAKPALEKLALRWLVFSLASYGAWIIVVVPFKVAVMPITLVTILVGLAEIRIGYIKLLLDLATHHSGDGGQGGK